MKECPSYVPKEETKYTNLKKQSMVSAESLNMFYNVLWSNHFVGLKCNKTGFLIFFWDEIKFSNMLILCSDGDVDDNAMAKRNESWLSY